MPPEQRVLIDYDVILFIEALPRRQGRALRNRFVEIAEFPTHYSDCQERDAKGRFLDIHIFGRFAIRYWDDVNDGHLKILEIGLADRA